MFDINRIICVVVLLCVCCGAQAAQTLFNGDESIPAYAERLFDGKDLSEWVYSATGKPADWKLQDDYMQVRGGDIQTRRSFTDFQLHVEFWLPDTGEAKGQARANSGVYLQNAYEIQVLDSYGLVSQVGDCGAIYSFAAPMVNACRKPEHWQTFDVFFRAAKFDAQGAKVKNAVVSVQQNGIWIHHCFEVPGPTSGGGDKDPQAGPIRLQDHGNPVRYRNIWILPFEPVK